MGISALSFLFSHKASAQVPTASFSINQSNICVGGTVQLTDASSDSPTAWSYTIESTATTATVQNPVFSFATAGIYSITLVASNVSGDSAPFTETLSVNALPSVYAGPSATVCSGDAITLAGTGANTYTWSGGIIDGSTFSATTSLVYTVTGTDLNGCENTDSRSITVNNLPTLSVGGGTAVCLGSAISLTVSGADTYTWSGGSNLDVFSDSPLVSTVYAVSGTNTLTGCANTFSNSVTVNALPTVVANSGSVCLGSVFTINPSGATSYVYSNGSNTVSPTVDASYTVTGTDANGCSSTAVSNVTVNALPVVTVSDGTVCAGNSFVLSPSGAVTYTYSSPSATVTPAANTTYSVTGTDNNGCVSAVAVANVSVQALPVVTINNGAICAGDVFTLNPSGALTYTLSSVTNTVAPTSNTSYTVTGTDANGCVSLPAVSSLTVNTLPVIGVNSGSICAGNVFTMIPTGAATYTFANGSATVNPLTNTSYSVTGTSAQGCVSSVSAVSNVTVLTLPVVSATSGSVCLGSSFTIVGSGASTYSITGGSFNVTPATTATYAVTGVDVNGCVSSNTAIATVTVQALPVLSISTATAICVGETATLTVSGAATYSWNTTSTASSLTVAPTVNTTYSVTGTDANGCSNSASQSIVVNTLPTVTVNSGAVCPGGSFTLMPTGASVYVYSGGSGVVTPVSTTIYTVTGTDANGCVSSAVATINVVNSLTITVSGNTTICSGQTASLTAGGANTYSWSNSASGSTVALTPGTTTSYTVTGTSSNCSNTAVVSISVNPLPVVTATSSSSAICLGESATLTTSGATSYVWDSGSNATSIVVNPTLTTTYTVTGTDANSCSNKATIVQTVNECTGLTKVSNAGVNVNLYPNPTNGNFTIQLENAASVKILNGIGEVVYTANLTIGENDFNLHNQPSGIYFVQLKQGNQSKTLKVVKN